MRKPKINFYHAILNEGGGSGGGGGGGGGSGGGGGVVEFKQYNCGGGGI